MKEQAGKQNRNFEDIVAERYGVSIYIKEIFIFRVIREIVFVSVLCHETLLNWVDIKFQIYIPLKPFSAFCYYVNLCNILIDIMKKVYKI